MTARKPTEETVSSPITPPIDPDATGPGAAETQDTTGFTPTPEQQAQIDLDDAATARAAALLQLQATVEMPLTVAPPARFTVPVYTATGLVRHWEPGGTLYLVESKMFNTAIGDRYLSAHGGTVVELTPDNAARGLELGQLSEYVTAPSE